MPRDSQTRICTQSEVSCYDAAEDSLMLSELTESLASGSGVNKLGKTNCNCLPSCTSINYDAELSQADFEFVKVFNAYGADLNEFPGAILARLTIFFKEAQFITSKRSELYGLTDFMANCGGLLGETTSGAIRFSLSCFTLVFQGFSWAFQSSRWLKFSTTSPFGLLATSTWRGTRRSKLESLVLLTLITFRESKSITLQGTRWKNRTKKSKKMKLENFRGKTCLWYLDLQSCFPGLFLKRNPNGLWNSDLRKTFLRKVIRNVFSIICCMIYWKNKLIDVSKLWKIQNLKSTF